MTKTGDSLPLPAGTSTHVLKGASLKRWWQISSKRSDTKNPAVQHLFALLLTLPFVASVACEKCPESYRTGLLALAGVTWLSALLVFLSIARRHLYHVLEVRTSDEGLEFKSLLWKQKVRWTEIADFFPAGDGEIAQNKYVLETSNGEEFLLSKELTESNHLFNLIIRKMPHATESYQQSYHILEGFVDQSIIASFAITLAFTFPLLRAISVTAQPNISDWLLATAGILIAGTFYWFHNYKIPETIRVGSRGLFLRTRSGAYAIPREQITHIKQVGGLFFLRSRQEWFVILTDKKEPVTGKLIEYKHTLPLLK